MKWKELLRPVNSLDAREARDLLEREQSGSVQLLDVRQPHEYAREHIPGAKLVPLPELTDHLDELERDQPLLVYCAVGGRSRVAAQLLAGRGFSRVMNLQGGISAWQGRKARGPMEGPPIPWSPGMDWRQACRLAYAMEQNLGALYGRLAERASREDLKSLLHALAGYEDKHKERLLALYQELSESPPDPAAFSEESAQAFLEGGWTVQEILDSNRDTLKTEQDAIELAMMIETQALDLYLRWAEQSTPEESKTLYRKLADEERGHLRRLGEFSGSAGERGPGSL